MRAEVVILSGHAAQAGEVRAQAELDHLERALAGFIAEPISGWRARARAVRALGPSLHLRP